MATVSFTFPGWQFEGAQSPSPSTNATITSESWLEDLNELSGDDEEVVDNQPKPSAHSDTSGSGDISRPSEDGTDGYNDDILHAIFSLLPEVADLCTARLASWQWCHVASTDDLWLTRWHAHERFSRLQRARVPCAFRGGLAPAAPPHRAFMQYATACRANRAGLLRWMDLQLGWNRLEALLAPDGNGANEPAVLSPVVSPTASPNAPRRRKRDDCDAADMKEAGGSASGSGSGDPNAGGSGCSSSGGGGGESAASTSDPGTKPSPWRDGLSLSAPARTQARKLAGILAARNWEQLHSCVLYMQLECAEQLARAIAPKARVVRAAEEGASAEEAAEDGTVAHEAAEDEALLVRLIHGWRRFHEWLAGLCGCFSHYAGSPCRTHLICLLAAQRSNERVDQHTPSLLHAGFAAFRHAVLLHPTIAPALARYVHRAAASIMAEGGYTNESGRRMQALIDLQDVCATVDAARDDHLCEERGEAFTQEALRDALLTPIKELWASYARTWFCGTRIDEEELGLLGLYEGSKHRRRQERRVANRASAASVRI